MADKKISEFSSLAGSGVDVDNDVLEIIDTSETNAIRKNKKIAVKELVANTSAFLQSGSGATARTVSGKFQEFPVSVLDFGGGVDKTAAQNKTAILAALAECANHGDAGAVLYFPGNDEEYVSNPVELTDLTHRVRWVGDGMRASRVKFEGGSTGAGTAAIYLNFSDSSWSGAENIRITAGAAYQSVVRIFKPNNNCTWRGAFLHGGGLCDYAVYAEEGSVISFEDCYTAAVLKQNFFSKNQSSSTQFLIVGGNNGIGDEGLFYAESTFGGPNVFIYGGRYEDCTSKDLFQYETTGGQLRILGAMFTVGAPNSVMRRVSGTMPQYTIDAIFTTRPTNLIVDDVSTLDVETQSGDGMQMLSSAPVVFRTMRVRGATNSDTEREFQKTTGTLYSVFASGANFLRFRDKTNAVDMVTMGSRGLRLGSTSHPELNKDGVQCSGAGWGFSTDSGRFRASPLSPAEITANQNNYNPGTNGVWRLSSDASRTITGISGPVAGDYLEIINVGSNDIVLANESASSTAGNRIITGLGADLTLNAGEWARLWYDSTSSRWRVLGTTGA